MKKRIFTVIIATLMVCTAFAGCGSGNPASVAPSAGGASQAGSNAAETPSASAQESVSANLRFSWWGNDARHEATIKAIDMYEAANPGITIEPEYRGKSEREKIATELAGGTIADLVQLNPPWMGDFTNNVDFFVDLGEKGDLLDTSGFDPDFLQEYGYYNGKLLAVPMGVNSRTTIINKTLAEKLGLPTGIDTKWTWDDMHTFGKTVNEQEPDSYFLNADTVDMVEFVLRPYIIQQTGEQLIKEDYTLGFTREQLVDAFNYIGKLYSDKVVIPVEEGNVFMNSPWTNPKWISGQMASEFSWTSLYTAITADISGETGVFGIPVHASAKNTGIVVTPSQVLAVSNKSQNVDEAVKFMNYFLNNVETGVVLGDVRAMPPVSSVQQACLDAGLIDSEIIAATDYASKNRGLSPNTISTNAEITQVLQDAVEKISYDPSQTEAAADQAITLIEDILNGMK